MKNILCNEIKHNILRCVALVVSILLCQNVLSTDRTYYFDNSATQWANVGLLVGKSGWVHIYGCSKVGGTDVWSCTYDTWGDQTEVYWVNAKNRDGESGTISTYAAGFQDRNITVNQQTSLEAFKALDGKIFVPESAIGREAGTTWKTYTASDYTSITGNGRLIQTNGFAIDDMSYAYVAVKKTDMSNPDYGENGSILKGGYWYTSEGSGGVVMDASYVGFNSTDDDYLYKFSLGSYFEKLRPLSDAATTGSTSPENAAPYYFDGNSGKWDLTLCGACSSGYYRITGTVSANQTMSSFTSLGSPTISSSPSSGSLGTEFTITLTAASNSTLSGGNTYRIYATDGENLYEICQPQTEATSVTWTPTTAASWTLYSIVTDKYGAERKKSEEITVSNCGTPAAKTILADVTTICSGNDITITVPTSESGYIYTVYTEGGSVLGKGDGTGFDLGIVINPKNSYTISVKAAKAESCPGTAMNNTIAVIVNQTPVLSESSTTQYKPVTVTGTSSSTWDVVAPSNTKSYFTDASGKTTVFKGSCVNSGGTLSDAEYVIMDTSTASNCSATLTVSENAEVCEE